jgi:[citrate (pro-3S)-lyase] ligase
MPKGNFMIDITHWTFGNDGVWNKEIIDSGKAVMLKADGKTSGKWAELPYEFKSGRVYHYEIKFKCNTAKAPVVIYAVGAKNKTWQEIWRDKPENNEWTVISGNYTPSKNFSKFVVNSRDFMGDDAYISFANITVTELDISATKYNEQMSVIFGCGYSLLQYIADTMQGRIWIYTDNRHLPLLQSTYIQNQLFKQEHQNFDLRFIMDEKSKVNALYGGALNHYHFGAVGDSKIDGTDTVIVFCDDVYEKKLKYFNKFTEKIATLRAFLDDVVEFALRSRQIVIFLEMHPDILMINSAIKGFPAVGRTTHEQSVVDRHLGYKQWVALLKENKDFDRYGLGNEDLTVSEVHSLYKSPPSYTKTNGVRVLEDFASSFVNTRNGRRVTVEQPSDPEKTIWLVGNCTTFGVGSRDEHSPASFLQNSLNKAGYNIAVENCGQFLWGGSSNYGYILANLPLKSGDIVILLTPYTKRELNYPNYRKITVAFERPYKYGEIFTDTGNHKTPHGNHEIADSLFAYLTENEILTQNRIEQSKQTNGLHLPALLGIPSWSNALYGNGEQQIENPYGKELKLYKQQLKDRYAQKIGAIVMNCNPFTLGHRYLIEYAALQVSHLYIFAVEEDKSIFPFKDRFELIKAGTADLPNVTVLPSGKFIISSLTFTEYFNKSEMQDRIIDPSNDVTIFADEIAPTLGITVRFAGEEPLDNVTRQYNDAMRRILPQRGIEFCVIPRKEENGTPISASRVRKLLGEKNFAEIATIVPKTTLAYLQEKYGG